MEKNTIWFVVTSIAFLLLWYKFFPPAPASPRKTPVEQKSPEAPGPAAARKEEAPSVIKRAQPPVKTAAVPHSERLLETEHAKVAMDSQGAGVRHWWIKERGRTVDLVQGQALELATFPEIQFAQVPGGKANEAEWKATLPSGLEMRKKLVLDERSPFATLTMALRNPGKEAVQIRNFAVGWENGLGTVESEQSENEDVTRVLGYPSPTKEVQVFKTGSYPLIYRWAGIDNRYFLVAFFPKPEDFNTVLAVKEKKVPPSIKISADMINVGGGETRVLEVPSYAGPKGYTSLKSWNKSLEHAVDFGFFGFLGRAALKAMYAVYKQTHNYGAAIIVLTLCLQVIVFPLTLSSYKSMAVMKRLQPKMQEIQKKNKGDSKALSQEMMRLYKEAGTTPFSGCLPMLIQMPVFIAFFTMLRNSYELNGAPFMGWIQDLSKHDPYYVLPILTGAIMYLQQYISGSSTTADPTQKQMMLMMPIVFTFVFLRSPSGLALYWLTNSLVSMVVQFWAAKKYGSPAPQK